MTTILSTKYTISALCVALCTTFYTTSVTANNSYTTNARITAVEPVYREQTIRKPYQDCYVKTVYEQPKPSGNGSATNELLGGIIGGAIGNQFGGGSGKDALTVAGALLGASVANDMEQTNTTQGQYVDKRICETKYDYITENRFSHYNVSYQYAGETYSFKSSTRPADDTISLRVNLSPLVR